MKKNDGMNTPRRFALLSVLSLSVCSLFADVSNGAPNYSYGAQGLAEMTTTLLASIGYVVALLYAIASLLAIYNATVIYIKLQMGEEGFAKSVVMLIGAILFLIAATTVMPAFFGYSYTGGDMPRFNSPFG